MVLESMHRMLLPMLQWDKEGVQAVTSEFPAHNYTSKQCTALETMLEILKVCVNVASFPGSYGSKIIHETIAWKEGGA